MTETIIVAVLSLIGTLGGSWMGVRQSNKLTNYRIGKLEEKVMKHNNLVERMVAVEQSAKSAHHRIDELKHGMEE
ncbi:MAG: hypothetical protein HP061_12120 [Christensenellaceae bacterium]|jgi:hypothetical protein|nr:hypothetical protein [Christensenellaceae bacterium]